MFFTPSLTEMTFFWVDLKGAKFWLNSPETCLNPFYSYSSTHLPNVCAPSPWHQSILKMFLKMYPEFTWKSWYEPNLVKKWPEYAHISTILAIFKPSYKNKTQYKKIYLQWNRSLHTIPLLSIKNKSAKKY